MFTYLNRRCLISNKLNLNICSIHSTCINQKETPLNPKNVTVYSFANPSKHEKSAERLYVWGYAGVGALGFFLKKNNSSN